VLTTSATQVPIHRRWLGFAATPWAISTLGKSKIVNGLASSFTYVPKACHEMPTTMAFYQGFGEAC
jgi:hypothetical protein